MNVTMFKAGEGTELYVVKRMLGGVEHAAAGLSAVVARRTLASSLAA